MVSLFFILSFAISVIVYLVVRTLTNASTYHKYRELLSKTPKLTGYIDKSEFTGFNDAAKSFGLAIAYGRVNSETGLQSYTIIEQ